MRSIVNFILSRNRSFFGARCLVVFLLIGAMIIPIASNTGSAQSPDSGPKSKADELRERARAARLASLQADADKPHTLAASYYSLQGNLKATLMLNNKGPKPLDVQPTFFNLFGDRLDVPAVTVGANTFREIDLSEWAGLGGRMFNEGSLQLFYKGPDLLMGAQVRMVDPRFSLMFDEQLVEPAAKYSSSRLEGVWLLPSRYCQLRVVLTNTTDDPLSLSVTVDGAGAKQREAVTLTLRPRETRVMDGRQGLMEKQGGGLAEAGGISIHHSGAGGALIARGMISETAMGYSSAVEFLDPQQAKSSRLHGAGLRLGRAGGEQLTAEVVARNIGEAETVLRGRIPYTTSDGSAGEIAVNEVRLRPGEVRRLNLNRAANLPQREEIASAGLELEYDGKPGSVIVSALSASRSRDHVYEVPMLDPAAQQSSTGGYPWRIEGGSSTFVYIKNVSDKSQQYHLQLSCEVEGQEGEIGVYSPGLVTVEAGQTITLDIRQLRDEQVADEAGRLIPVEANRGQVMWSVRGGDNLSLIGRAEQADDDEALSSTYACQNCCPDSFYDGWCDPFSVEGIVGSTEQFNANQQDRNCYGTVLSSYVVFASWSSSDTSIATVDGNGLATAQGVGSTDIFASWYVSTFLSMEGFPECIESEDPFFASSICQVRPTITGIDQTRALIGVVIDVTIQGTGLGSATEIDAGTGITAEIDTPFVTNNEVGATFTIAHNATPGVHQVRVRSGGQWSNTINFYVQVPTKLRRDSISNLMTETNGTINGVPNLCGAYRTLVYTLMDQDNPAQPIITNQPIREVFSNYQGPQGLSPSDETEPLDEGRLGDFLGFATPAPDCPPVFQATFTQKFKVFVGLLVYDLSTTNSIVYARDASGAYTITATITTP